MFILLCSHIITFYRTNVTKYLSRQQHVDKQLTGRTNFRRFDAVQIAWHAATSDVTGLMPLLLITLIDVHC